MSWCHHSLATLADPGDRCALLRDAPGVAVLASDDSDQMLRWLIAARAAGVALALAPAGHSDFGPLAGRAVAAGPDWQVSIPSGDLTGFPAQAGVLLRSSGSMGAPRWVMRSWDSIAAEGARYRALFGGWDGPVATGLSLHHAFALGLILGALLHGAEVAVAPRFVPGEVARRVMAGADALHALTPATARLVALAAAGMVPQAAATRLVIGAGPLTAELAQQLARFTRPLCRNYGSSETGAILATDGVSDCGDRTGWPMPDAALRIDDAGLLWCRTDPPFLGYWSDDGRDTRTVGPDGWLCLGDRAVASDDGAIAIGGRFGGAVRINDQGVDPHEVERVLRTFAGVVDAVVTVRTGASGRLELVADVERAPDTPCDAGEVAGQCRARLPAAWCPVQVRVHDALPRTGAGKPDRARLGMAPLAQGIVARRVASARLALTLIDGAAEQTAGQGARDERVRLLEAAAGPCDPPSAWERWWVEVAGAPAHLAARIDDRVPPAQPPPEVLAGYRRDMAGAGRMIARRIAAMVPPGRVGEIGMPGALFLPILSAAGVAGPGSASWDLGDAEWMAPQGALDVLILHNAVRRLALPAPGALIRAAARALRPGGRIILSDILPDIVADRPDERALHVALAVEWMEAGLAPIAGAADAAARIGIAAHFGEPVAEAGLFRAYIGEVQG